MQGYVRLFGTDSIDCLLADREFVGDQRVKRLGENHICIRKNLWIDNSRKGDSAAVSVANVYICRRC